MPKFLVKSGSLKYTNTLFLEGSTVEMPAEIAEQAVQLGTLVPLAKAPDAEANAKKDKKG